MITLFIDTSSYGVSIAVLNGDKVLASIVRNIPLQHSVYTVSFIDEVLKKASIRPDHVNKIMVVTGPGSFTGLRIGVTIAKVFAYLEDIMVIPVSSLKARSLSLEHDYCMSLIDAHHYHYYMGLYDSSNHEVVLEQYISKEKLVDYIHKYHPVIIGDCDGKIDDIDYFKQELDISLVVRYYQDMEAMNPHLVNPNYLKLPQVLEDRND